MGTRYLIIICSLMYIYTYLFNFYSFFFGVKNYLKTHIVIIIKMEKKRRRNYFCMLILQVSEQLEYERIFD